MKQGHLTKSTSYVYLFISSSSFKIDMSLIKYVYIFFQMAAQGQAWQKDAADQNFDYMFKLLVIGNSSVGKTSFLFRYADDSFTSAFVSTVGIDFKVKTVFRQDKRVKLQIWVSFEKENSSFYWYFWTCRVNDTHCNDFSVYMCRNSNIIR